MIQMQMRGKGSGEGRIESGGRGFLGGAKTSEFDRTGVLKLSESQLNRDG